MEHKKHLILKSASLILVCILLTGCGQNEHVIMLEGKNSTLEKENRRLKEQIEDLRVENARLKKQVKNLVRLNDEVRVESLYELESVKLTRYTNFYDRDKDGRKEKLVVYIQPIDSQADIIKATGSVEVELWDLDAESDKALLARWEVAPAELKKMWFGTIVTANYRLVFDITGLVDAFDKSYTVKMTFTDYVSGRSFTDQRVIKPAQ